MVNWTLFASEYSRIPNNTGWIDCDGGSNADVDLSVDANGPGPNGVAQLDVGLGAGDSGPGAGVLRVLLQSVESGSSQIECDQVDYSSVPVIETAFTTATATSTIFNVRQHTEQTVFPDPDTIVSLGGLPFDCSLWQTG